MHLIAYKIAIFSLYDKSKFIVQIHMPISSYQLLLIKSRSVELYATSL